MFEDRNGALEKVEVKPEPLEHPPFELQLLNFTQAVRGEAPALNNADQAVALMEMIDAIYASSDLGRRGPDFEPGNCQKKSGLIHLRWLPATNKCYKSNLL